MAAADCRDVANIACMGAQQKAAIGKRVDVPSVEADMAYFEARLSLADLAPDTSYQRAQIKTYQTLGRLLAETLERLRLPAKGEAGGSQR
ncbi:MAG: hypothetical protein KDJ27_06885 [Gammaproteobacteria bacterium]|nr:hypothetical protein [Gammaproteobacteria bacterium]